MQGPVNLLSGVAMHTALMCFQRCSEAESRANKGARGKLLVSKHFKREW